MITKMQPGKHDQGNEAGQRGEKPDAADSPSENASKALTNTKPPARPAIKPTKSAEAEVLDYQEKLDEKAREEELSYWLAFSETPASGLGIQKVKLLYQRLGSLKSAWQADLDELQQHTRLKRETLQGFMENKRRVDPQELLAKVKNAGVQAYYLYDSYYPARLQQIHDPPLVLFVKGKLRLEDMRFTIGVVGTRRPTIYGQRHAKTMARELAQSGVTVISGMAVGIDSLAHWGAIDGGGKTLAVLGCGVDVCYPSSNRHLYERLTEGEQAAVVSEFFPGTKPDTWHFPARNRIIAGLSDGVLVVEAGESSGSLITAEMAFEQSRQVFALPGRVDSPASAGTNDLIAKQHAQLVMNARNIFWHLGWEKTSSAQAEATIVQLYGRERDVFALIDREPVQFDYLCEQSGLSAGELSATLTMLELAGIVTRLPGDWYERDKSISVNN